MDKSEQILLKILKRFKEKGLAQVSGYKSFGYLRETPKSVYVSREDGEDTPVSHKLLLMGIGAYLQNPSLYNEGPVELRRFKITHVTSPIFALLHLIPKEEYMGKD
jgi:hypothetical protein